MSRSVRFIQLAIAVALGLGLLAVFAFALFGDALRQEANAPTGLVSTPSPEKLAASVASAQADAPKLLPPLDVRPVVYEETAGDQRMDRLEQSVGRLAGLLEEQATQAASPRAALDHPAPAFAPLPIGQLAPAYAAAGAFVQPGPAARLAQAGPFPADPAIPRFGDPAAMPPAGQFESLPMPTSPAAPIELETNRDIPLRDLIHLLGKGAGFNVVVSPSVEGTVSASLRDVTGLDAMDALLRAHGYVSRRDGAFLFVGQPGDFTDMERLDDRMAHRVYRPRYVTATELQTLLTPMLSETGRMTVTTAAQVGIATSGDQTGGDAYAGEELLLVRDWESDLKEMDSVVADVDQMPLQASIEAVILSVELDDEHRAGVNLELLRGSDHARIVSGTPTTTIAAMDFTDGGLNVGFLSAHVGAFIEAVEEIGDTQVVARPRLTCVNKQRAEILIGDQIGYLSTTQTETATTQTVEFLDVGTQLRIRPFISPEGVIRLEVHPELSSGEVKLVGDTPLPEKSTTQVTTNILCRDGSTIVIGGLIREETVVQTGQVPILGDVPYLGVLFRHNTETVRRTELIVLITPRILRDPLDGCEPQSKWDGLPERQIAQFQGEKYHWLAAQRHAQQYGRLAQTAYIAANYERAYRYAMIALQFESDNDTALKILAKLNMEAPAMGEPLPADAVLLPSPGGPAAPYPSSGTEIYAPASAPPVETYPSAEVGISPPVEPYPYATGPQEEPLSPPVIDVVPSPPQEYRP
jgi:type IV pilus assembly protein PilQ